MCLSPHLLATVRRSPITKHLQARACYSNTPAYLTPPHTSSVLPSASATSATLFPSPFPAALPINLPNPFVLCVHACIKVHLANLKRWYTKKWFQRKAGGGATCGKNITPVDGIQFHPSSHFVVVRLSACFFFFFFFFTAFHFYLPPSNVCLCCLLSSSEVPVQFQKLLFRFIQDDKLYSPGLQKTRSAGTHLARPPNSRLDLMWCF